MAKILTSDWGNLNKNLIASFWEVDRHGIKKEESSTVMTAVTDCSLDVSVNWVSPFENIGSDRVFPTVSSALQTGQVSALIDNVASTIGLGNDESEPPVGESLSGRSGLTKLNSVQAFKGAPPLGIRVTVLFRAWLDPKREVVEPSDQLMQWLLAEEISDNGFIANVITQEKDGFIETVLPTKVPRLVAFNYRGRTYSPLVMETAAIPLTSPIDKHGQPVELLIPIKLGSYTSIDAGDWKNLSNKKMI